MMNTKSFIANIEKSIRNHWASPALTDFSGETVTYGQVAHKVAKLHLAFEVFGLEKSDKVYDLYGKIVALVYPDCDIVSSENFSNDELDEKLDKIRLEINKQLPPYSQIARIKIYPEEFEKTPKKSIKRYLYTNR
jgi:long-chain acyl-CoA synthetase